MTHTTDVLCYNCLHKDACEIGRMVHYSSKDRVTIQVTWCLDYQPIETDENEPRRVKRRIKLR